MGSSRTDLRTDVEKGPVRIPNVKAWRMAVAAGAAADRVYRQTWSGRVTGVEQLGERFLYWHLLPFCRKYVRKFHNTSWRPWKAKPVSKYGDLPELREAVNSVLDLSLDCGTYEGKFFTFVPSVMYGMVQSRTEPDLSSRLSKTRDPLRMHYEGKWYSVSADLDGLSVYLDPHTEDQTAYDVAELLAYHPYLVNFL